MLDAGLHALLFASGTEDMEDRCRQLEQAISATRRDKLPAVRSIVLSEANARAPLPPESAVLCTAALHLLGMDKRKMLRAVTSLLPGDLAPGLYELLLQVLYPEGPPVSGDELYQLTQYTYLDSSVLFRLADVLTSALPRPVRPGLPLFLYLLSLRSDLSRQHRRLALLLLHTLCPGIPLGPDDHPVMREYQRYHRNMRAARGTAYGTVRTRTGTRRDADHASFYLDKYFKDMPHTGSREPGSPGKNSPGKNSPGTDSPGAGAPGSGSPAAGSRQPGVEPAPGAPEGASVDASKKTAPAPKKQPQAGAGGGKHPDTGAETGISARKRLIVPVLAGAGLCATALLALLLPMGCGRVQEEPPLPASRGAESRETGHPGAPAAADGGRKELEELQRSYTVNRGDTLWEIAERYLQDPERYTEIADTNGIPNPDLIQPGETLKIPGRP
jgi:nucleoid-associated protein YgaU